MKLSMQEKIDMLKDGQDPKRREHFRKARNPRGPQTFEAYLRALDAAQQLLPNHWRRKFVPYPNNQL